MGRDVSGLRLDRKSSNVVNGTSMNNATDDAAAVNETPPESQFSATEESSDKEEGGGVPGGKNAANHEPEEKIIEEAEIQKLTSPGESAVNGTANGTTENNDAASEAFPKSTDDSNSSSQPAKKSEVTVVTYANEGVKLYNNLMPIVFFKSSSSKVVMAITTKRRTIGRWLPRILLKSHNRNFLTHCEDHRPGCSEIHVLRASAEA
ncbi:hypothetical protein M569_13114 [Genlisea aurea]|uniref:Uncharacterized protein n=1 Tax=Genlisea aurea TaxID=192259 RepID=S8CBC6_9LAMI|nr:hypothetical protein M569_13114 [Genlisea aurea]